MTWNCKYVWLSIYLIFIDIKRETKLIHIERLGTINHPYFKSTENKIKRDHAHMVACEGNGKRFMQIFTTTSKYLICL